MYGVLGVYCPCSVHSGQELLFETSRERTSEAWRESLLQGLFGGYSFYDYLVCVRMLSLPRAVVVTQQLKTQVRLPAQLSGVSGPTL